MKCKVVGIAGIGRFLTGCAAYQMPPLSRNHPASADAVATPRAQRSQTLAYTRSDMPSRTPIRETAVAQNRGNTPSHPGSGSEKTVIGEGKVIATVPDSGQLVVDHGEIQGFMGAMTWLPCRTSVSAQRRETRGPGSLYHRRCQESDRED